MKWSTSYASEENDVIKLWTSCNDPIACILEKPLVNKPGKEFNYSGGDIILLGEIVRNATGMNIESFSWAYLFLPMGIEDPQWSWINHNVVYAGGDQMLTSRDMLKLGVTYLNNGVWEGQRILANRGFGKALHPTVPGSTLSCNLSHQEKTPGGGAAMPTLGGHTNSPRV